jgi:O-acetyl-ADP-ribose deacetylase (regulator of RNase III)
MSVPSESAAFERPAGRSILRIFHGDLATVRADVLVASDDDQLLVDGGVAVSFEGAGGPTIYEEVRPSLPVELGAVIPTTAGRLRSAAGLSRHCGRPDRSEADDDRADP